MSLHDERDYYQQQADNPANTPSDRALWLILAHELSRLIEDDEDQDHPTLF